LPFEPPLDGGSAVGGGVGVLFGGLGGLGVVVGGLGVVVGGLGVRLRGFSNALDELWQHRLRASRDLTVFGEWNLNLNGTILWWDSDVDFILAFYLQRTF
jgi:hypothetical protein